MKEIEKEIVTKRFVYVAEDGTEFNDKDECRKYEESAKGVLLGKYSPKVVKESYEYRVFGVGSEDNHLDIVRVETQEDADLILQLLFVHNSYYTDEAHKERREKVIAQVNSAIGDYLVVGRGYDHDDFWIYGSRNSIINDFNKNFENL